MIEITQADHDKLLAAQSERDRLLALINTPELQDFLRATHLEAIHQVERWGEANDRAKRPADWFWLVGYLAGKALHAAVSGNVDKAMHHCISTSAALYNWHCAIKGQDVRKCSDSSDVAAIVEKAFPGEVAISQEMVPKPPVYFAVLHAAKRDSSVPCGEPGHYQSVQRDDPAANEFRAEYFIEWGKRSTPLGPNREAAEMLIHSLNAAFNFGLVHARKIAEDFRAEPVLVGRMGHINRNEEAMP